MINNFETYPIKDKLAKPIIICISVFSMFIFILFNIFSIHILNLYKNSNLTDTALFKINMLFLISLILFVSICIILVLKFCKLLSDSLMHISNDAKKLVDSSYRIEKIKSFSCNELQDLNININNLAKTLFDYHKCQKTIQAKASHELRTPLMSIQGYAEGIKYNIFDDINEPLDIIIEESIHLTNTIKSMLTISGFDCQTIDLNYINLNLYSILEKFITRLGGVAVKLNKKVTLQGDDTLSIYTDENTLSVVINNILSNALRHAHTEVNVSFKLDNNNILIYIKDDGDGISSEDFENIFTRFYKGKNGNLGLGLSIAKSAIEYLDGNIDAYNHSNGACFILSLKHKK